MSTENVNNKRLQELGGSDYEIADGQPDIRGWDLNNESGNKIGTVKELLFDESSRKVRYIIAKLKSEDDAVDGRKVLVPIGVARLHESDDDVVLPGITAAQLQSLPEYDEDNLTADTEYNIGTIFSGAAGAGIVGTAFVPGSGTIDDLYDTDHYNDDNLYKNRLPVADTSETIPVIKEELQVGKREVQTGGVRLKSRIVEKPVEEDIILREEKVVVERTTVDRPADAADIKEDYIEITEKAEVPVVSKEARVVEEISLSKDVTEKEETISETVRNTEVDIEKTDKDGNISTGSGSY